MSTRSAGTVLDRKVSRTEFCTTGVLVFFTDGTQAWFDHDQLADLRRPTKEAS